MAGGKEGKSKEVAARAAKAVVKSGDLESIWQCWRGVVQQQVERGGPAVGAAGCVWDPILGRCRRERRPVVTRERGEGAGLPGLCGGSPAVLATLAVLQARGQVQRRALCFLLGCCCASVLPLLSQLAASSR